MSPITIIWSMVASACLTLAAIHLLVWCRRRTAWGRLLFCLAAAATAAMAFFELRIMGAQTAEQMASAVRWDHVPVCVMIVSLVGFVRVELQAGRPWLAWTIGVLRALILLLNFTVEQNLNFRETAGPGRVALFGETVSVFQGAPNPWAIIGQVSLLLLLVFVTDAAITV